ncbi:GumC family protein [Kaistia granuli]|uniref:GumC family protein n=1 Tax=Kaistia granuli TaxID=363259 RepID=UPI00036E1A2E|nr:GumC family protein [Kaistia granuli]
MNDVSHDIGKANGASGDAGPWPMAFAILVKTLRRWIWIILAAGIVFGLLAVVAKSLMPQRYTATAQFLLDPRGLPIFPGDLSVAQFDANSQIGVVESQMRIITSERVLSKVLADEALMDALMPRDGGEGTAPADPMPLRPSLDVSGNKAAALTVLQRAISVQRAERSFVIDVTATARTPVLAAELANAVVKAYLEEDAANRGEAAKRLTDELTGRLETLRQRLRDSEAKANSFRIESGLISTGDRLVVEQKLAEAVTELSAAQLRLDQATSRAAQLDSAQRDLGMLGANDDMRSLTPLIERQNAARENIAVLAARLGDRHPALSEARDRLEEIGRRIDVELGWIKQAAQADLERARTTQQALSRSVATFSDQVAKTQQAKLEMRALEQEVETNRTLLESFKTRALQVGEFGRIDPGAVRIVSVAQPPPERRGLKGLVLWGAFGAVMGMILAAAFATFKAMLSIGAAMSRGAASAGARPHATRERAASEGVALPS